MKILLRGVLLTQSFVLSGLVLLLWARSYSAGDTLRKGDDAQHIRLGSARGIALVQFAADGNGFRWPRGYRREQADRPDDLLVQAHFPEDYNASLVNRLGFGYEQHTLTWPRQQLIATLFVPHWALLLLVGGRAFSWCWRQLMRPAADPKQNGDFAWCPQCCFQHEIGASKLCGCCKGPLAVRIRDDIVAA